VKLKLLPLVVKWWSEKSGSYIKLSFSKTSMQRNRLETYQNLISAGPIRVTAKGVPREEKAFKWQTDKLAFYTIILKYHSIFIERRGRALGRKGCKRKTDGAKQSYTVLSTRVSASICVSKSAEPEPQI
jgi:hypothetical protein